VGPVLSPDYPIETERLSLRPFRADDFEALHRIHSEPLVTEHLYWYPRDERKVREVLEQKIDGAEIRERGKGLTMAVELRDSPGAIGDVDLFWTSPEHRQGEVGYVFDPAHHGKGYATEAVAVLLELGFDGLGLHRITGRLDARNEASARVLEKNGMRREAHLVENELVKGVWTDELIYAILEREWRARADG
jgi:RimJ/RimL family protein N-acetyltransferase